MTTRPNILWLCTDQQRYDTISACGAEAISTPHLDRLATAGVTFERAYCQSPVCAPSRASFLTGRYPRTTGCRQNGQTLPADEVLVSRRFADAGYSCGLAGKLHLASCSDGKVEQRGDDGYHEFAWSHHPQPDWGRSNAYTAWLEDRGVSWDSLYNQPRHPSDYVQHGVPAEHHQTTWCAERAIAFLEHNHDRPWFFSFNCFAPHHPFDPPQEYLERFNPSTMALPKPAGRHTGVLTSFQELDRQWAHNSPGEFHTGGMNDADHQLVRAAYYAMCQHIDDEVGRILDALESTGQAGNTIVIFMSDHGEMLGDHGLYFKGPHFYEEAIRVPLIIRWPDRFAAGHRVTGLTELLDLPPTLLAAADLEIPDGVQGRSLLPQLCGERNDTDRDSVFCEYYNAWTHSDAYASMLRTSTEKIVVYHGTDQGELYDLEQDPDEFHNLWDDPVRAPLKTRLLQTCFDRSVLTLDPLPLRRGPF